MTFHEWLPITTRNRVALGLAALALVTFVTWNCLPYYKWPGEPSEGIVLGSIWPEIFSPAFYIDTIKSPDIEGFLGIAASVALIQSGLVILIAVPFWEILHASPYIRLPLALVNLAGGSVILWHLQTLEASENFQLPPYRVETFWLISMSFLTISAALFLFKNELALREARKHGLSEE